MEFKGTKGEWLTEGRTLYSLQDSDSRFVDKENRFSAGFFGYKNCPESEVLANVKLCAAAPKMLAALQDMVALVKSRTYPQPDKPLSDWGRAEAAEQIIKQALGEV